MRRISDAGLFKDAIAVKDMIKARVKDESTLELIDAARIDLFTEIGVKRQVDLLLRETEMPALPPLHVSKSAEPGTFIAECGDPEIQTGIWDENYINNMGHFFNGAVRIILEPNRTIVSSDHSDLSARLLRVAQSDAVSQRENAHIRLSASDDVVGLAQKMPQIIHLPVSQVRKYLGEKITNQHILKALKRFGYSVDEIHTDHLQVRVPAFRYDVHSTSDIVEDIMLDTMSLIQAEESLSVRRLRPNSMTIRESEKYDSIRHHLCYLGYKEVRLPILSKDTSGNVSGRNTVVQDERGKASYVLRSDLAGTLIEYEQSRQHLVYPHKIFELGTVIADGREAVHLGVLISQNNPNFNAVYSDIFHVLHSQLSKKITLAHRESDVYEEGCSFSILLDNESIGEIGVLSTAALKRNRIRQPCIYAEISFTNEV